jgi:hypothetical protein
MGNKLALVLGGLLAALLLVGAVGASVAYAQEDPPPAPPFGGRGPRHGGPGGPGLEAAAEALGMTTDELAAALRDGQTLEQLAEEAGVELQTVRDAMQAAHAEALRAHIEQALAEGSLSQEKADWLLEGLDRGFLDGPGFGLGLHGPRFGPAPADEAGNQ